MKEKETKLFIVSALHVAAEAWDGLARDAAIDDFAQKAAHARDLALSMERELDQNDGGHSDAKTRMA